MNLKIKSVKYLSTITLITILITGYSLIDKEVFNHSCILYAMSQDSKVLFYNINMAEEQLIHSTINTSQQRKKRKKGNEAETKFFVFCLLL